MAELKNITTSPGNLFQSPFLELEASGSTGQDGSTPGIHLRWFLQGQLGDNHLPKGNAILEPNYAPVGKVGFNKTDDFVKVYRIPYKKRFPSTVNLLSDAISRIDTRGRYWEFKKEVNQVAHTELAINVRVSFKNAASYDSAVRGDLNKEEDRLAFLNAYQGVIEYEALNELSFAARLRVKKKDAIADNATSVRLEGISLPDNVQLESNELSAENAFISYRNNFSFVSSDEVKPDIPVIDNHVVLDPSELNTFDFLAPNLKLFRFDLQNCIPIELQLETYQAFIIGSSGLETPWESVGEENGFALTTNDALAFNRLDNSSLNIDGNWPKYRPNTANNGNTISPVLGTEQGPDGSYKAKTSNYEGAWTNNEGLRNAVDSYLSLSKEPGNLGASLEAPAGSDQLDVDYLLALNFASVDFHVARMLGLGHIDTNVFSEFNVPEKYIYLIRYNTDVPLINSSTQDQNSHFMMTLPLAANDEAIPQTPELDEFSFRVPGDDFDISVSPFDKEGYSNDRAERFISIQLKDQSTPFQFGDFFFRPDSVLYENLSNPIAYGIEYKGQENGAWEQNYRLEKLHTDREFTDALGNKEIIPLLAGEGSSIFTHLEREGGFHRYAPYAINVFSRPSELGAPKDIFTIFNKSVKILSPTNLYAAVVQKEQPLILSSPRDQQMLDNISGPDKTLIKTVFTLDNTHFSNHQLIDQVEFFYNENLPDRLSGKVSAVYPDPANRQLAIVETDKMVLQSVNPTETLDPLVSSISGDAQQKFKGGLLACQNGGFVIENVSADINGRAIFKVFKKAVTSPEVIDGSAGDDFSLSQEIILPELGEYFTAVENKLNLKNWEKNGVTNILDKRIPIKNFSPSFAELREAGGSSFAVSEVLGVQLVLADTDVVLRSFPNPDPSKTYELIYEQHLGVKNITFETQLFLHGDQVDEFNGVSSFRFGEVEHDENKFSGTNTIEYTISSVGFDSELNRTEIVTVESIPNPEVSYASIVLKKTAQVLAFDGNRVRVKGNVTGGFMLTNYEVIYTGADVNNRFSKDRVPALIGAGGLVDFAEITPIYDELGDNGYPTHLGRYAVSFNTKGLQDPSVDVNDPHYSSDTEYFGGALRLRFGPENEPRNLEVESIHRTFTAGENPQVDLGEISPASDPVLRLIVKDSSFNPNSPASNEHLISNPGRVTSAVNDDGELEYQVVTNSIERQVSYLPNYLVYLRSESGKMEDDQVFPIGNEDEKESILGARTVDSYCVEISNQGEVVKTSGVPVINGYSPVSKPAPIKAVRIIAPVDPEKPVAPSFATRPDVYVKSSFTMDVAFPSEPYAIILYRASTAGILNLLYSPDTINEIKNNLSTIDEAFLTNVWSTLVNLVRGDASASNLFKVFEGFEWPMPDNPRFQVPSAAPRENPWFAFLDQPQDLDVLLVDPENSEISISVYDLIDLSIRSAFTPLQERPIIWADMKNRTQTSSERPVIRDTNGELLKRTSEEYNPSPMAVNITSTRSGNDYAVRFTDFTLDGASNELYFYFAMSMGNQMDFSKRSEVIGPIFLVNSAPAKPPVLRKVTTQLADPLQEIPTAVRFEIDQYLEVEKIKKIQVYRTSTIENTNSVRNMKLVKEQDVSGNAEDVIIDDFNSDGFPPYGDPLYYRLVALREIKNEAGLIESIPSEPSQKIMATIVDVFNPEAPELRITTQSSTANQLTGVKLEWDKTVNNGIYRVFKLTNAGNWSLIEEIVDNSDIVTYEIGTLVKTDEDGDTIYHRYKVDVENSSGLLNLSPKELTI